MSLVCTFKENWCDFSLKSCMAIFSKNPHIRTWWFKNPQAENWQLNTQTYKTLLSLAKKNRVLYKRISPILMVKILYFNCMRTTRENTLLYWNVLMFFMELDCLPSCISNTIFLPMVTLWQPLKNNNLKEHSHAELWKTTLKYKNLFSLTSKILGSYMWVFTVWGTGNF